MCAGTDIYTKMIKHKIEQSRKKRGAKAPTIEENKTARLKPVASGFAFS